MLASLNPLTFDGRIELTPDHKYVLDGLGVAPLSATKLIEGQSSEPFDQRVVIMKNLKTWRERSSSKFHTLVENLTDEQAIEEIGALWQASAMEGTSLHRQLELVCNGEAPEEPQRHAVELSQFEAIRRTHPKLKPFRTELSLVALDSSGRPVLGGQLDLLVKDDNSRFHIVDFKRTDKNLAKEAASFGRTLLGRPDNPHHRYSLQCSLYAVMLEAQEEIVVDSICVIQLHPDLGKGRLTVLTDLRDEARTLLRGQC